jgi:hypothetical protein
LEVVIVADAAVPLVPEFVPGIPAPGSKGEAVFAPVIPKTTADALAPVTVTVIVIVPLDGQTAYHISRW